MASLPFTEDIEPLLENMDGIPIDDNVPFSDAFKKVMEATEGNPWGANTTPGSKLATRLHFAGWSRRELEAVGLKPKHVENFRGAHDLTAKRVGRPSKKKSKAIEVKPSVDPIEAIHAKCAELSGLIAEQQALIEKARIVIEGAETELKKQEEALAVLSS